MSASDPRNVPFANLKNTERVFNAAAFRHSVDPITAKSPPRMVTRADGSPRRGDHVSEEGGDSGIRRERERAREREEEIMFAAETVGAG